MFDYFEMAKHMEREEHAKNSRAFIKNKDKPNEANVNRIVWRSDNEQRE